MISIQQNYFIKINEINLFDNTHCIIVSQMVANYIDFL